MRSVPGGDGSGGAAPWQLLPPLSPSEKASLKVDIAANGVRVAVVIDAGTGAVIDGHHRILAWQELRAEGVPLPPYPRDVRAFASDEERLAFVLAANLFRRHLSRDQRSELVAGLRRRGWSLRRIGAALGSGEATVRRDLAGIASDDAIALPERVERQGGGTYPARRAKPPASVLVHSERDERRAREALTTMGEAAPGRPLVLRDAERFARKAAYLKAREATVPADHAEGARWGLRAGDFAEVLADLPDGSVDMVICDPPYVAEFDGRWADLAAVCARLLKEGAPAVFYTGHHNLPDVIGQLCRHLDWLWHVALVQPRRESRMNVVQVHNGHRDLLVLSHGAYRPRRWLRDTLTESTQPDKTLHPWQQQLDGPLYLIDILCEPGGLVLDPCCGVGTFGVAALRSERRFLGVDVDPVTLGIAAKRLQAAGTDGGEGEPA